MKETNERQIQTESGETILLTWSDPEPVQEDRLLDYLGTFADQGGEFYVPPISLSGLSKMKAANGHHGSCVIFRRNMLSICYSGGGLSISDFKAVATDFVTFGNAYIQVFRNIFGGITGLKHIPAINMRVKTKKIGGGGFRLLQMNGNYMDFRNDEIFHLKEYDTQQQIYGAGDWLGGLQSALLNQDATLFRRKYYVNGAHLGYILYTNDAKMNPRVVDALQEKVAQGKGAGNFRSLHLHIPNGNEKGIQVVPIGDISQKDEFLNIKNISAADVREAHRVPPVLMGIVPLGTSSLGDPEKVERVYLRTEVKPMAQVFMDLNDELPKQLQLKFDFKTEGDDNNDD